MKTELRLLHLKISLKQIAIYRIPGTRTAKHKQLLNSEINWRAKHLK